MKIHQQRDLEYYVCGSPTREHVQNVHACIRLKFEGSNNNNKYIHQEPGYFSAKLGCSVAFALFNCLQRCASTRQQQNLSWISHPIKAYATCSAALALFLHCACVRLLWFRWLPIVLVHMPRGFQNEGWLKQPCVCVTLICKTIENPSIHVFMMDLYMRLFFFLVGRAIELRQICICNNSFEVHTSNNRNVNIIMIFSEASSKLVHINAINECLIRHYFKYSTDIMKCIKQTRWIETVGPYRSIKPWDIINSFA